jgi:hypothetical protein
LNMKGAGGCAFTLTSSPAIRAVRVRSLIQQRD